MLFMFMKPKVVFFERFLKQAEEERFFKEEEERFLKQAEEQRFLKQAASGSPSCS